MQYLLSLNQRQFLSFFFLFKANIPVVKQVLYCHLELTVIIGILCNYLTNEL